MLLHLRHIRGRPHRAEVSEGDSEANDPVLHKGGVRFFSALDRRRSAGEKIFINLQTGRCYS